MQYKDIEIFLELVRTRNITKAAEHLFVSQSAVSNRLKSLEEELGCQLMVRAKGHRAIQLTRQGEAFLLVAERWKNVFEETEMFKSGALTTLRLATNESTYYEIIAPLLQQFFSKYTQYKIAVQVCDSELTYGLMEKNLIDFGFVSFESTRPETVCRCICRQPLCIIRYSKDPKPGLTIRPDQLDPTKEIHFTGGHFSGMSRWREKWFGLNPEYRMEVNSSRGIVPFMRNSDNWALCPLDFAERLAEELSLQIYWLEDEPEPWKIYLLKKQGNYLDNIEVCRLFEQELSHFMENHYQNGERNMSK